MSATSFTVILFLLITALFAVFIARSRQEDKKRIEKILRNSWGSEKPQLFSAEKISMIRAYSDASAEADGLTFRIDDITAGDLDLDRIYGHICRTFSGPGEETLYMWLRHPAVSRKIPERRRQISAFFADHENVRSSVSEILIRTGGLRKASYYEALSSLENAGEIGRGKYLVLSSLTALGFLLLFIRPLAAVIALVPLLFLNLGKYFVLFLDFRVHLAMREKTGTASRGFEAVIRLVRAAERLSHTDIPPFDGYDRMRAAAESLRPIERYSFLIAPDTGTGIGAAVMEYIRMFFHIDLILFDALIRVVREHRDDIFALYESVGTLDACLSLASWRASVSVSSDAELHEISGPEAEICAAGLLHPLLTGGVPNSLVTHEQILLTGANASGKSTFLKSMALLALFAQSFGFVCAESYSAPLFRIMTSMALADNLTEGDSYFVVELRSLKRICDAAAEEGPPVLAMVDEVLRGTNTAERIAASSAVLRRLAGQNIRIFAATHDIELTELLRDVFRNMHFSEEVRDGDVCFDYLLKEGPSRGRNAIRLLDVMGFDGTITDRALKTVRHFDESGEWI